MFPDLEPVAHAFALLARGRPLIATPAGTAEAPILLSEIAAYCALFAVSDPEEVVPLLRCMDEAYLRARADRDLGNKKKD